MVGKTSARSLLGTIAGIVFKAVAIGCMIVAPLLGVWVASSLVALRNGPVWTTVLAGLLLFPILPIAWEMGSSYRRARRAKNRPRLLTLADRLVLRTLFLNACFVGMLLAAQPSTVFTALSARGDWMLDGHDGQQARSARASLFWIAGKLDGLYVAVHRNPFREVSKEVPIPSPSTTASSTRPPIAEVPQPRPAPTPALDAPAPERNSRGWPLPEVLHPAVAGMPPNAETSIQAVAQYLSERTADPLDRLKALHDWVADRVRYDVESYRAGRYPPQDAEAVFVSRTSVCAGYAQLLVSLGRASGLEVVYITGDARTQGNDLSGQGHAWNAARVNGQWYLIDPTWDSGTVSGSKFDRHYRTEYFLTPPQVFAIDHLPDDAKWQLLASPLSRGEFLRQPAMSPRFFANALELVAPERSQVDVHRQLVVSIKNPNQVFLLASYDVRGRNLDESSDCEIQNGSDARITCAFPGPGRYDVKLFSNREQAGTYRFIGQLQANSD